MVRAQYKDWLTPDKLSVLQGWARDGLTDAQIAHNIGIRRPTLYDWKNKHPDIADALKKGKQVVDIQVENALLKKAMGMTTTSTTYKMVKVNEDVLKVQRFRYVNQYKIDHPDMTKAELQEIKMRAIEEIPTYERIPIMVNENQLAPDTSAAIFWLKNRKPDQYRDQSNRELNNAQAERAKAEAEIAKAKADILTGNNSDGDRTVIIDDI